MAASSPELPLRRRMASSVATSRTGRWRVPLMPRSHSRWASSGPAYDGPAAAGIRDGEAAVLAHRAQDQEVAHRLRHADAGRDGVRILPAWGMLLPLFPGADHRRAAGGLHRHHARAPGADEADGLQLGEGLPHADQAGAAAGGIEDDVRHLPPQLFGQFQPHGLLALDPVGLLEGRDVEPAGLGLALADDLAAIIDQAVDAVDGGALQLDLRESAGQKMVVRCRRGCRPTAPPRCR